LEIRGFGSALIFKDGDLNELRVAVGCVIAQDQARYRTFDWSAQGKKCQAFIYCPRNSCEVAYIILFVRKK